MPGSLTSAFTSIDASLAYSIPALRKEFEEATAAYSGPSEAEVLDGVQRYMNDVEGMHATLVRMFEDE
jgi:hypothetical protein